MSTSIIDKIDELLKDDRNFDTRSGLRFLMEVIKDSFQYIESQKKADQEKTEKLTSFDTRIKNVENGLYEFLEKRKEEQKEASEERKFYRRAVVGGIIGIAISELARWFLT